MNEIELLEGGEIVNTHGIRGELRVLPWTDTPQFLCKFKTLYIEGTAFTVLHARVHKGCVILQLAGISDCTAAEAYRGKTVYFNKAEAVLPKGHCFISDLMNAEVITESGEKVGNLTDILELPAGLVYVVTGTGGEHLIPAVDEFILHSDAKEKRITVHLIEGM